MHFFITFHTTKLMQFIRTLGTVVRTRVYKDVHSMCILHIRKQAGAYIVLTYSYIQSVQRCNQQIAYLRDLIEPYSSSHVCTTNLLHTLKIFSSIFSAGMMIVPRERIPFLSHAPISLCSNHCSLDIRSRSQPST